MRLLREGWWVAVLALVLSAAAVIWVLRLQPDGPRRPQVPGFDLGTTVVPRESIVSSGMPRDGLRALVDPRVLSTAEVDLEGSGKMLVGDDRVVGVVVGEAARAYPLRLMRWHEVVNDTLGGAPILVTYSPLCDSTVVFRRLLDGAAPLFGVSGLLHDSNLLLYDRGADPSLWSQLQGRAVTGPSAGTLLEPIPAGVVRWEDWRREQPHTTVLAPAAGMERRYRRDPYHSYFGSDRLRFPVEPIPARSDLRLKDHVAAVTVDGRTAVFALPRLAAAVGADAGTWATTIADVPVLLTFRLQPATASATGPDGEVLPTVLSFWFAWHAAHPADEPGPLPSL